MIKKGSVPKKKVVKKTRKTADKPKVFKPVPKEDKDKIETFLQPVLECDLFSVKEFWGKASELNYSEFTVVVRKITDETANSNSRVRATAITALASIANGVSWEIPPGVMDRALVLTGDGSKEVRFRNCHVLCSKMATYLEAIPSIRYSLATVYVSDEHFTCENTVFFYLFFANVKFFVSKSGIVTFEALFVS